MSDELKPTDDQCDRIVALTMDKLAAKGCDQYGDMHALDLNPNIMEHHSLRRSIVRAAYGVGEAEAIAAWNRRAQPEPADALEQQAMEIALRRGERMRLESELLDARTRMADQAAQTTELQDLLIRNGFVRCDIPACNCGSWHARYGLPERMQEIKDTLSDAGG